MPFMSFSEKKVFIGLTRLQSYILIKNSNIYISWSCSDLKENLWMVGTVIILCLFMLSMGQKENVYTILDVTDWSSCEIAWNFTGEMDNGHVKYFEFKKSFLLNITTLCPLCSLILVKKGLGRSY